MTRLKIRPILLISLAVVSLTLVLLARHHWITQGAQKTQIEAVNTTIKIRQKYNEIRNHRPDNSQLLERLRDHSY